MLTAKEAHRHNPSREKEHMGMDPCSPHAAYNKKGVEGCQSCNEPHGSQLTCLQAWLRGLKSNDSSK